MIVMKTPLAFFLAASAQIASAQAPAYQPTEQELFLAAVTSISPTLGSTLLQVGNEYRERCGHEPTVDQYKVLAESSEGFFFLAAAFNMTKSDYKNLPDDIKQEFQVRAAKTACFTPQKQEKSPRSQR